MPIGIQRLNAKKSHPNDRIVFIKPLKGPDEAVAQDFLERIAAQCLPIMKEHHLNVMSLEEYEPNREFLGRNFNAGEVIQLVLKARSGRWLSFHEVQLVMMHELAHCTQMNHSRAFWDVRNRYAEQMESLWARGYTGEGLWGRGALLSSGEFERNTAPAGEGSPAHLCGGTYRSRRRKRKAKKSFTYQEQKERRILKKFGANGVALGDDEAAKRRLEKGRTNSAKPRVAGSKRGRELRAAAALARFDKTAKEEDKPTKLKAEEEAETASEDSDDGYEDAEPGSTDAVDINGIKLLDGKGRGMVKVCEDEDPDDHDAKNELLELQSSMRKWQNGIISSNPNPPALDENQEPQDSSTHQERSKVSERNGKANTSLDPSTSMRGKATDVTRREKVSPRETVKPTPPLEVSIPRQMAKCVCPVCSFTNDMMSVTCVMCANVLDQEKVPNSWSCQSQACQGSTYFNAGDCGVCGVCGQRRST